MAAKEILLLGNPALRMKCATIRTFSGGSLRRTVRDLRDTLDHFRKAHGWGRGIAAPQIGVAERIIFINIDRPMAIINPEIMRRSRRRITMWDDCFSFPDILVKVTRHADIAVRFRDEQGRKRTVEATNGLSELLQHEIDHLDGVLAIDRAIDSTSIVLRSEWKKTPVALRTGYPSSIT